MTVFGFDEGLDLSKPFQLNPQRTRVSAGQERCDGVPPCPGWDCSLEEQVLSLGDWGWSSATCCLWG